MLRSHAVTHFATLTARVSARDGVGEALVGAGVGVGGGEAHDGGAGRRVLRDAPRVRVRVEARRVVIPVNQIHENLPKP